jgi:hypothetical protein
VEGLGDRAWLLGVEEVMGRGAGGTCGVCGREEVLGGRKGVIGGGGASRRPLDVRRAGLHLLHTHGRKGKTQCGLGVHTMMEFVVVSVACCAGGSGCCSRCSCGANWLAGAWQRPCCRAYSC